MQKDTPFTSLQPVSAQRRDYCLTSLSRKNLNQNPFQQFDLWFQEANACHDILEPNAMTLSTAGSDLRITSRTVLLKGYGDDGFRFFTNVTSQKGKQMAENWHVALLFFWPALERQIKISGTVTLLPRAATEAYFYARPRSSQLGAWASFQSRILPDRQALETRMEMLQEKFKDQEIPVPDFWSGYLVAPDSIEFWQGRSNRLHDCFRYLKKEENQWLLERLNP